jgi:hypothetical protein
LPAAYTPLNALLVVSRWCLGSVVVKCNRRK